MRFYLCTWRQIIKKLSDVFYSKFFVNLFTLALGVGYLGKGRGGGGARERNQKKFHATRGI